MKQNQKMRQAIQFARQGEGVVFNEPYMSLTIYCENKLVKSWYNGGNIRLESFLNETTISGNITLVIPYELPITDEFDRFLSRHHFEIILIGTPHFHQPHRIKTTYPFLSVIENINRNECDRLNEVYFYAQQTHLPFICLSFGMSLDGKIATHTGESKYISGEQSRQFVHRLRHRYAAILVGINTVLIDNPSLTTRFKSKRGKDAHRIIFDSQLRFPLNSKMIQQPSNAKTIIVTTHQSDVHKKKLLEAQGVIIIEIEQSQPTLNLKEALTKLYALGIDSILVEGGGTIHFSFIESGYFNRIYATISPLIIGGDKAKSSVGGVGFASLSDATKLTFHALHHAGKDIIIEAEKISNNIKKKEEK